MASQRPFIVIVPGGSQNPAHYGYFSHLLQRAGYPVFSALLPSVGASGNVTVQDDADFIRERMLLPVLDHEERDVVLFMHSYSSVPGSAAAKGLSKLERATQGKKTGVVGHIYLCSILAKGGDGGDILGAFGGNFPPHIRADTEANLLRCDDRIPPLYQDVPTDLAGAVAAAAMGQGMTSFKSPIPRATWDSDDYKGRVAFIRTVNDAAIPLAVQQIMLDGTGVDWIVKDVESGHSPQLSQPKELTNMVIELAQAFEGL